MRLSELQAGAFKQVEQSSGVIHLLKKVELTAGDTSEATAEYDVLNPDLVTNQLITLIWKLNYELVVVEDMCQQKR